MKPSSNSGLCVKVKFSSSSLGKDVGPYVPTQGKTWRFLRIGCVLLESCIRRECYRWMNEPRASSIIPGLAENQQFLEALKPKELQSHVLSGSESFPRQPASKSDGFVGKLRKMDTSVDNKGVF